MLIVTLWPTLGQSDLPEAALGPQRSPRQAVIPSDERTGRTRRTGHRQIPPERQVPDRDHEVINWLRRFLPVGQRQPTGRLLMTLNEAIADGFAYSRRTAPGTQSPAETLTS